MMKKKLMIPVILILMLLVPIFSGCTDPYGPGPIKTINVSRFPLKYLITGTWRECKTENHFFVYDTEPHENWEDYKYTFTAYQVEPGDVGWFRGKIDIFDLEIGVKYYVKAVAYCYELTGQYDGFEDGWYTGLDLTFKIQEVPPPTD